ncbi:hypothetical protein JHU04_002542 [Brenneria sp. 4F2]|nr:hypothetical protein [Brenneria bubanii]
MPTGTLSLTNASDQAVGINTKFTEEVKAADIISAVSGGITYLLSVASVESDTSLTLIRTFTGATAAGLSFYVLPASLLFSVPAQLAYDIEYQIKIAARDKANWQAVYSQSEDITVTLADGSTFSGPSWKKLADDLAAISEKNGSPPVSSGVFPHTAMSAATAATLDVTTYGCFIVTLNSASCELSISGASSTENLSQEVIVFLVQGSGANKVTWPQNVKWPNGVAPALSYTQGQQDVVTLVTNDNGSTWLGIYSGAGY